MANTKSAPSRPVPRLYLATPEMDDPSALVESLTSLLAGADVAAVLLRLKPVDQRTMITRVKTLAPVIQAAGAAVLLDGHVELVARAGADGAHVTGVAAMEDALPSLKPDRIIGVGGLTTRHDSMSAGEAGADYVLFGEPDANGERPSAGAIAERLNWWAELFEPPCVGFAVSRDEAHEFAAAGADFRAGRRFHLERCARPGDGTVRGRTDHPDGPRGSIQKSHGRGIAPAMKLLRSITGPISGLVVLTTAVGLGAGVARAQMSITPPAATPPAAAKPGAPPKPKPPIKETAKETRKPGGPKSETFPTPTVPPTPAPVPDDPNADYVYAAYQRGQYKTAFDLATKRVAEKNDPKAMTMLGELYSNGFGVKRDYDKAIEWYRRGSDAGDREGMFALAMLRLGGRGGPKGGEDAAKLLAASAKLGSPAATYNLALLYIDGQILPQDMRRAAELLRIAADAGNPEAQYALATFYRDGTGVPKNVEKSVSLLQAAALADNVEAEVEYAIALYNGTGTPKNQAAAVALLRKAARQNSPIAQNRLAWVLSGSQATPAEKIDGLKWHIVAKTAGKGDPMLDEAFAGMSPADRAKAEASARQWLGAAK